MGRCAGNNGNSDFIGVQEENRRSWRKIPSKENNKEAQWSGIKSVYVFRTRKRLAKGKKMLSAKGAESGEGREGDWECSSCNNRNYAFRSFCNRCKQPRLLVDTKTPADSKWLPRIGDWICTG
ncbi:hypothetical protein V8G54_004255 [Vigna mungo]|uniref:RanBP2-type domain-containing protein n=1 Tax=Vigna mungo TaxID=3915 RepID=A0AAQ3SEW4_VIGMU